MSTCGDLERAFADLYPYRWAFAAGFIAFMALAVGVAGPRKNEREYALGDSMIRQLKIGKGPFQVGAKGHGGLSAL